MDSNNQQKRVKYTADEIIEKDILELMGAKEMPEEQKERIYKSMIETIETRVIAKIDDQLTDEEAKRLKEIVNTGSKEEFDKYMKELDINVDQIYAQEAMIYKMEMVQLMQDKEE
jgi:hypothetical protein